MGVRAFLSALQGFCECPDGSDTLASLPVNRGVVTVTEVSHPTNYNKLQNKTDQCCVLTLVFLNLGLSNLTKTYFISQSRGVANLLLPQK